MADLPDASAKLRTVLDYVPCEACLAQPVRDQDVLCSICRRVDRQVGVRVAVRRTVLVERPSEPEPVVIPPPAPAAPATQPLDVVLAAPGEPLPEPRPGVTQVVLEPLAPPPPAAPPEEPEPAFDDLVGYEAPSDAFGYVPPARAPERAPEPEPIPREEYVFAPPPPEPEPEPPRAPDAVEDWLPTEEAVVQEEPSAWAPARQDEPPEPEPQPEPVPEPEPEPVVEDEVLETEVVEEVVEMEVLPEEDEAPARGDSDLWRLRGFDAASEAALAGAGIQAVAHLAGHDAGELSARTGLEAGRLARWVQVADLTQEAGVPLDAAIALVTAGVAGPRGLREMDAQAVVERAHAFGGMDLSLSDVKRWKRRV